MARAEETAGQVTCSSSSSPCPGHQASLLGSGDVSLVSTPESFPNLCYKIIKSRVGKFCFSWLSLASRFISLFARTEVNTGENKVCSPLAMEINVFLLLKKH